MLKKAFVTLCNLKATFKNFVDSKKMPKFALAKEK